MRKVFQASLLFVSGILSFSKILIDSLAIGFMGHPHTNIKIIGIGSHFEIVHLGPFVKGVVVALSTLQTGTQENTHRIGHIVEGHTCIPQIIGGGRVVKNQSMPAYQLVYEVIVRSVVSYLILYPFPIIKSVINIGGYA